MLVVLGRRAPRLSRKLLKETPLCKEGVGGVDVAQPSGMVACTSSDHIRPVTARKRFIIRSTLLVIRTAPASSGALAAIPGKLHQSRDHPLALLLHIAGLSRRMFYHDLKGAGQRTSTLA